MNKQVIEFFATHTQDTCFEALGYVFVDFDKAIAMIGGTTATVTTHTRAQVEQLLKEEIEKDGAAAVAEKYGFEFPEIPAPVVEESPAPVVEEAPAPVVEEAPAPVVEEKPAVEVPAFPTDKVEEGAAASTVKGKGKQGK